MGIDARFRQFSAFRGEAFRSSCGFRTPFRPAMLAGMTEPAATLPLVASVLALSLVVYAVFAALAILYGT